MMREVEVSIARLPVTNRELFGREVELAWLDACWNEGVHVASVIAWGGIGKTALVNRWLAGQRDNGWDGAARVYAWSFYSQGTDRLGSSDEFIDAALRWFGDPDPTAGSPWDKGERLARLVRKERTLLVLDGVEPLQWGPGVQVGKLKDPALEALVKELGAQNKGLCLITSRIAVADLEALEGDKVRAKDLGSLSPEAGAELLKARGAKGTGEELREASTEYKGHGLALTLLGGYIRKRHKGDIRQRAHIPVLEGRPAQRMMGIYERWFAGKPEIAVLRLLGLFDRPAPKDEIEALRDMPYVPGLTMFLKGLKAGAWNEAVTTLQDVGLLAPASDHDNRLDAHPLVREHFGARLRQKQPEAWREGHRRLYVHLRNKAEPLPETVEEMAPLYAAVVHGCLAGKNQEAFIEVYWKRIQREKEHFSFHKLGAFGGGLAIVSAFFNPPWERLASGLSEPIERFVLNEAGIVLRALGRLPEAAGLLQRGLERHIAQKDWKNAANSASNLSELLYASGGLNKALAQARRSVEFADTSGDAFERIASKTTLAAVLHAMGLRDEASAQFEEAERMQNDRELAAPQLYSLQGFQYCDLLLDQGQDAEVRRRVAQMQEIAARNNWVLDIALSHLSLGRAHIIAIQRGTIGELAQAISLLERAVYGLRSAGDQSYVPLGLLARSTLHTHTRDFPAARHDLDETLTLATRCGFCLHEADAHLGHARLALAEGYPAPAREHLARARRIVDESGYHRRDGELAELETKVSELAKAGPHESLLEASVTAPLPSAHVTVRTTLFLDGATIRELHAATLSANLIWSRDALMAGIDGGFVAGLASAPTPAAQLMIDLDALNKAGALADATVPLQIWLANAAQLAGMRVESAIFTRIRDRLSAATPAREAPAATAPRLDVLSMERLLDALGSLLPAQLDTLIFKLGVPVAFLSGATAPPATRSIEVLRWAEQANRLADVGRLLAEISGAGRRTR
jgi:tetratricopeptide (TPR) repeat protein